MIGWGIIAGLIAVAIAVWSYARLPVRVPRGWLGTLGAMRALAVWALLWLLIEPVWNRVVSRSRRPTLLLLADNSRSVFWRGALSPTLYKEELLRLVRRLEEKGWQVRSYAWDETLRPLDSLNGQGNLSHLTLSLRKAYERESQAALAVLVSDGRETGERVPVPSGLPVWTVGVGPPPLQDAAVEAVEVPAWIAEGESPTLRIKLRGNYPSGSVEIRVGEYAERLSVSSSASVLNVPLPKLNAGSYPLRVRLIVPNDPNPANNEWQELISVRRQRWIFHLWAGEITPDIAFLRRLLERMGKVYLIAARSEGGYTLSSDTLQKGIGVIPIFYNFPRRREDFPLAEKIIAENAFLIAVWGAIPMEGVFWQQLGIQASPRLEARSLPQGVSLFIHRRPLFSAPSQAIDIGWGYPIAYRRYVGNKLLTLLPGEGWWRLREYPYLAMQWDSLMVALISEGMLLQQSKILFFPRRSRIAEGEPVYWEGFVPEGTELRVGQTVLPLRRRPDGLTEAVWIPPRAGLYPYELRLQGNLLLSGSIWVEPLGSRELQTLGRDTLYLAYLARSTEGRYFSWESRDSLPEVLRLGQLPLTLQDITRETIPLHELGLWLALVLGLFCAEWVLRRYVGLY
ncbi:MAG: hypothetical protein NZ580_02095 [Bacteroidia bacterium]|nr:hypothetical protein [Bacteroidia bacterium]MDW8235761.1 hypothetical protein [Bacteroidia bacterium]